MDYAAIDGVLDDFKKILKSLQVKYDLMNAKIDRWRWDIPQINLSWLAQDAIWRNITVLVNIDEHSQGKLLGQVEVNAWQDVKKDNRWIRRWRHQGINSSIIQDVTVSRFYDDIFVHSYKTVADWRLDDLKEEYQLSADAAKFLEQQDKPRFIQASQQFPQSSRHGD